MIVNRLFFYRLYFSLLGSVAPRFTRLQAFSVFHTPSTYKRTLIEKEYLQKAKTFNISFEEYNIAGYRWGEEKNPKVLIVHGWTGVATSMYRVIGHLVENGYLNGSINLYGVYELTCSNEMKIIINQWID